MKDFKISHSSRSFKAPGSAHSSNKYLGVTYFSPMRNQIEWPPSLDPDYTANTFSKRARRDGCEHAYIMCSFLTFYFETISDLPKHSKNSYNFIRSINCQHFMTFAFIINDIFHSHSFAFSLSSSLLPFPTYAPESKSGPGFLLHP